MKIMDGAIIMIICVFVAAILALMGGIVLDNVYLMIEDAGLWNNIPTNWQTTGQLFSVINLYYFGCLVVGGAGVLVFVLSILEHQSSDQVQYYG